jgi:hypothetical protein
MLDALRGKNINDDDKQGSGIDMKLVEVSIEFKTISSHRYL